jgi:hypothetical protein
MEKIIARVYQINFLIKENVLIFFYDDFCIFYKYNRNNAYPFIRNILVKYGIAELHGVFKTTFKEVSKQYKDRTHQNH